MDQIAINYLAIPGLRHYESFPPNVKSKLLEALIQASNEYNRANATVEHIYGSRRSRNLVVIRQAYSFILKANYQTVSLTQIGKDLGGRDHTTIIHSIATFKNLLSTNDLEATYLFKHIIKQNII